MIRATAETVEVIRAQREAQFDEESFNESAATMSARRWGRTRKHSVPSRGEVRASEREVTESKRQAALNFFARLG